jgi:hypothetical protein
MTSSGFTAGDFSISSGVVTIANAGGYEFSLQLGSVFGTSNREVEVKCYYNNNDRPSLTTYATVNNNNNSIYVREFISGATANSTVKFTIRYLTANGSGTDIKYNNATIIIRKVI